MRRNGFGTHAFVRLVTVGLVCLFGAGAAARAADEGELAAEVMDIDLAAKGSVFFMELEVRNILGRGGAITRIAIQNHAWIQLSDPAFESTPAGWQGDRAGRIEAVLAAAQGKGLSTGQEMTIRLRFVRPPHETIENLFRGGEEGKTLFRVTATFADGRTAQALVPVPFLPTLE